MALLGIDFGTANIRAVAAPDSGRPMAATADAVPAVVGLSAGHIAVADAALFTAGPTDGVLCGIKRVLGRPADDEMVKRCAARGGFSARALGVADVELEDWQPGGRGRRMSVLQATAALLRHAAEVAARTRGPHDAVVALPSWYGAAQRDALVAAARLAQIRVVGLVHDTVAAALWAHGSVLELRGNVAVVDAGAGGVSVSVISVADDRIDLVSTYGSPLTGGDDIDAMLAEAALPDADRHTRELLRRACEEIKCELATAESAQRLVDAPSGEISVAIEHWELELMLSGIAESIGAGYRHVMGALTERQLDGVIAVGGLMALRPVMAQVIKLFGEPLTGIPPTLAPALGAVEYAAALDGRVGGPRLHSAQDIFALANESSPPADSDRAMVGPVTTRKKAVARHRPEVQRRISEVRMPREGEVPKHPTPRDRRSSWPAEIADPPRRPTPRDARQSSPESSDPTRHSTPRDRQRGSWPGDAPDSPRRATPGDRRPPSWPGDAPSSPRHPPRDRRPGSWPGEGAERHPSPARDSPRPDSPRPGSPRPDSTRPISSDPRRPAVHPPMRAAPDPGAPRRETVPQIDAAHRSSDSPSSGPPSSAPPSHAPPSHAPPSSAPPARATISPSGQSTFPAAMMPTSGHIVAPASAHELLTMPITGALQREGLEAMALPVLLRRVLSRRDVQGTVVVTAAGYEVRFQVDAGTCLVENIGALMHAFQLKRARWELTSERSTSRTTDRQSLARVALEGLKRMTREYGADALRDAFGPRADLAPKVAPDMVALPSRLGLAQRELRFLDTHVDGTRTARSLAEHGGLGAATTWQLFALLDLHDILSWDRVAVDSGPPLAEQLEQTASRLEGADHFVALGIHWSATNDEIKQKYAERRAEFARGTANDTAHANACARIRARLETAYSVLKDASTRVAYRNVTYKGYDFDAASDLAARRSKSLSMRGDEEAAKRSEAAAKELSRSVKPVPRADDDDDRG